MPAVEAFRAAILQAVEVARRGQVVILGVKPDAPSTAYGYIRPGAVIDPAAGACRVDRFVEKPDLATAQGYLREGCLWNSGNFIAPAALLLEELQDHSPQLLPPVARALAEAPTGAVRRLSAAFGATPKLSFDYGVMEKTSRAAVLPVDFAWSDLGAWDAVWAAGDHNPEANSVRGSALLIDTAGAVVRAAEGMMVSTVGVKNLAVIVEHDAVLVCALDSAQSVKTVVERINDRSWSPGPTTLNAGGDLPGLSRRLDDWLDVSALPLWWSLGADHRGGGFFEHLSLMGRPVECAHRRARVQMRQVYVYAAAGAAGWEGPWRQAVAHGLDYFETRYRRSDGQFRTLVDRSGAPCDDTAMLYDQAFALLGWATAAQATPGLALELKALELLDSMKRQRRCAAGGFTEAGEQSYQSNPHMHLLEAALAWMDVGRAPCWQALAQEIVNLALNRFIDPDHGYLREYFDANWRPAHGDLGRIVEPGHQFEWSWLLGRWFRQTGDRNALDAARILFKHGACGVDPRRGVAVDSLNDDLQVRNPQARLWPQTERLKAALLLTELDPTSGCFYEAEAAAAARSLISYLQAPVLGVWRDKLSADGSWKEEPAPASSLYHIAGAIWAFRRAQQVIKIDPGARLAKAAFLPPPALAVDGPARAYFSEGSV